jgi:hypothetical protein
MKLVLIVAVGVVGMVLLLTIVYTASAHTAAPTDVSHSESASEASADRPRGLREQRLSHGVVRGSDESSAFESAALLAPAHRRSGSAEGDHGGAELSSPIEPQSMLSAGTNAAVAAISEAARNRTGHSMRSAIVPPKPFDAAAYSRDPALYTDTVEPGRAYWSHDPGQGVPSLAPLGPTYVEAEMNAEVPMAVKTAPHGLVTFTSFDLGHFPNHLTSISIQADGEGRAVTTFTAAHGVNDFNILAGSPQASGQLTFCVMVEAPMSPDESRTTGTASGETP